MDEIISFFVKHWTLSALLITLLSFYIIVEVLYSHNDNKISSQGAIDLINHKNAVIIDIRTEAAFGFSHIVDAIHIPEDQLIENYKKIQKHAKKPIIIVDAVGKVSSKIIAKLQEQGFQQVVQLSGGMQEWLANGLPTTNNKGKSN
jgi:rhodanese-related sulfurtransferase